MYGFSKKKLDSDFFLPTALGGLLVLQGDLGRAISWSIVGKSIQGPWRIFSPRSKTGGWHLRFLLFLILAISTHECLIRIRAHLVRLNVNGDRLKQALSEPAPQLPPIPKHL